ncbi:MAG: glycosyltransferase family 2 protein [Gemmatimonadaceae bacterium]
MTTEASRQAAELAVVVPSVNGLQDLRGCLDALVSEAQQVALEVIVADRCGEAVRKAIRSEFPTVRLLVAPAETTIPDLRAMAFAATKAKSVAVIEDHVIVPPGWARRLLDAQKAGAAVVGGTVENAATGKLVDWAAFLCEYSHCMPPIPAGTATWLTGNNVVYRRELLERYRQVIARGAWENVLHDAMRRDGIELICRPEIHVWHKKHYTVSEYLHQRYLYARSYAGARVAGAAMPRRAMYGVAALMLPPLLFYRTVARVMRKRRNRIELLRSLPLIALFVSSWAAGEVVGYWLGPGDSLVRVC